MSTTAGVAAPPVTIYAIYSRWLQQPFATTLQPFFFAVAALSLSTKVSAGMGAQLGLAGGRVRRARPAGRSHGWRCAGRPARSHHARIVAVALAYLGAAATVIHALIIL